MAVVAVWLLRAPHAPGAVLLQLKDQVTPALAVSLATVAVSAAVALVASDAGTTASLTVICMIVMLAVGAASGAVTEEADTVTVWPTGATVGAV